MNFNQSNFTERSQMDNKVAEIRKEYAHKTLVETEIQPDPIKQFNVWWQDAMEAKITEANAMTLATASADGIPSARTVLLKGFSEQGFIFFTNYNSFKGQQLAENPKACLVFFWKELERQVRITGIVSKITEEESDAYFLSRPHESQVGAIASPQSQVVESRQWLDDRYSKLQAETEGKELKRPAHWGGYLVNPIIVEFWQGRPGRLHDRIQYGLQDDGNWKIERLAP